MKTGGSMTLSGKASGFLESLAIGVLGALAVLSGRFLVLAIAVAAVAGGLLALAQPLHALLAWVFLAPEATPYLQLSLPVGIPDLTFPRLGVGIVATSLVLSALFGERRLAPLGVVEKTMLIVLGIIYIDTALRGTDPASEALITLDEYALPFLLYYLAKNLFRSERDGKKFFSVMAALGIVLSIHGTYQYAIYGGAGSAQVELQSDEFIKERGHILEGRALGPFTNGMTYGATVSVAWLWTLYLVLYHGRGLGRWVLLAALGLMLIAAVLSLTRAIWLGLLLATLTVAALDARWRRAILGSLCALFVLGGFVWIAVSTALGDTRLESRALATNTVYQRIVLYRAAAAMVLDRPLFGFGRGERRFVDERQKYLEPVGSLPAAVGNTAGPPHNIYLFTLLQWGLVGLAAYLSVFGTLLASAMSLRRASRVDGYERRFAGFFIASTVLYMSYGLFVDSVALPFVAATYFIGAGIMAALQLSHADDGAGAHGL